MTQFMRGRFYIIPGFILTAWIGEVIWMISTAQTSKQTELSARLEEAIRVTDLPHPVANRLRLLRDMPSGLTSKEVATYLQLPEGHDGGWGTAHTQVTYWTIADRYIIVITEGELPINREAAWGVADVCILRLRGPDPIKDGYDPLSPHWTPKGLNFE